jgi:hypothetical protein
MVALRPEAAHIAPARSQFGFGHFTVLLADAQIEEYRCPNRVSYPSGKVAEAKFAGVLSPSRCSTVLVQTRAMAPFDGVVAHRQKTVQRSLQAPARQPQSGQRNRQSAQNRPAASAELRSVSDIKP